MWALVTTSSTFTSFSSRSFMAFTKQFSALLSLSISFFSMVTRLILFFEFTSIMTQVPHSTPCPGLSTTSFPTINNLLLLTEFSVHRWGFYKDHQSLFQFLVIVIFHKPNATTFSPLRLSKTLFWFSFQNESIVGTRYFSCKFEYASLSRKWSFRNFAKRANLEKLLPEQSKEDAICKSPPWRFLSNTGCEHHL